MDRPRFEAEVVEEFAKSRGWAGRFMDALGISSAREREKELARAMAQTELIMVTAALSELVYGLKKVGAHESLQELGATAVTASGWMAAQAALYAMGARRRAPEWSELADADVDVERSPREIQLEALVERCRAGGDLTGKDRRVADFAAMLGRLVKHSCLPWPPEVEQLNGCIPKPKGRGARPAAL